MPAVAVANFEPAAGASALARAEAVLHSVFSYKAFRSFQADAITALIGGADVLALMPTGAASRCSIRSLHSFAPERASWSRR